MKQSPTRANLLESAGRTPFLLVVAILFAQGCATFVRHRPQADVNNLRSAPPSLIAVLPLHNESDEPMAAAIARDALFYALSERGYRLADMGAIDRKLHDPSVAAALKRADGGFNVEAAGRIFGVDAVVGGRVLRVSRHDRFGLGWIGFKANAWMIDTHTGRTLWRDTASGLVRVLERPRRSKALTPAERKQAGLIRLCRAFDLFWQKMVQKIPAAEAQTNASTLNVRRVAARTARPVLSPGDRVEIVAEGTAGCVARAAIGTTGKVISLAIQRGERGVYRGAYTVQPDDGSHYTRVAVVLSAGDVFRRRLSPTNQGFIIDTVAPEPPTSLVYETRYSGLVLSWDASPSHDISHYMVYRTEGQSGAVRPLGTTVETSYLDRTAVGPQRYVYFVKAIDLAGNPSSSSAELAVDMPERGPSSVGGKIEGEVRWTAFGGPYRLTADVDVTPGATLIIEPDTSIEIPPGMEITIRGSVEAIGREGKPIRIVGTEASRGFYLCDEKALLRTSYVEISGARRGIEVADGECYIDQTTLRGNRIGLDGRGAARLVVSHSTFERNRFGALVGPNFEITSCEFINNDIGMRVVGDGGKIDRCVFDNIRADIMKVGSRPLRVDGNTFWTASPWRLFDHLWGNVTCSRIRVRRWPLRGERSVQFEPTAFWEERGDKAAADFEWEKALRAYKTALLQERNRQVAGKALKMFKQIVDADGPEALQREIDFCQSVALAFPGDVALLEHLARLLVRQGKVEKAREICSRILKVAPDNEFAKKTLAAAPVSPY